MFGIRNTQKKEKNLNVTNEDDVEIEPQLEKEQEPAARLSHVKCYRQR